MASSPYEELRAAQLCKVSNALARRRALVVGGFNLVIFSTLACAGVEPWRLWAVTLLGLAAFAWQLGRWWLHKRGWPKHDAGVYRTLVGMIVLQSATLALTGGLFSPLVPLLFPLLVSVLLSFGRGRRSLRVAGLVVFIALALAVASLSPWEAATPLPRAHHCLLAFASLLFGVYVLYMHVLAVTDAYSNAGEALGRVREDLLAQAGERARSLELVSAKVAHELKNPLAAIKGLAQLLGRNAPDTRTHERLEVISAEVTRMEAILRDYLSFSRPLEALRPGPVAVGPLVDDVLAVLEGRAEGAGVQLAREGEPVSLVGDGRRLKEAFLNLLTNAIEATPSGGSVTVQLRREGEGGEVVIRDTGRGIPEHLLSRVGSPFFTTREGGTGLGVALARAIIAQHGGTLHYRSEPGRGTVATVSLPRRPPCSPGATPAA
ncbi:MAG TPA: HAMP domain-containing sensor histidine kinase [Polyangiaceae bacterium]|nr:HAMP domain-containing sensor histidine kinase [Polyangiaceae bacterium]